MNNVFNKFIEILTSTIELFSVTKEIKERSAVNPWINNSIKNAVAKKFKRYKDYLKIPSPKNEELFKKSRANVKKLIRNCKKQYYSEKLEKCIKNPRKFYRELNNITGRFKTKQRFLLKDGGNDVTEPTDIANLFNHAFVSIGENLVKKIPAKK